MVNFRLVMTYNFHGGLIKVDIPTQGNLNKDLTFIEKIIYNQYHILNILPFLSIIVIVI